MRVVVLGASNKEERFSNKAIKMLQEYGHEVVPIHPTYDKIEGLKVVADLASVDGAVDTLTLYMSPARSLPLIDKMVALRPRRVIMNPGTESSELSEKLLENNIEVLEACTLVLLRSNQF